VPFAPIGVGTYNGAMLLLVPGLLCDRAIWAKQIDAFASSQEVSVPDLRGIDRIPIMAQRVLERAPERFSLAGHSLGGRIALEMMRQAPERIERLALLDTAVIGVQPGERERRMALVELADRSGMRAVADQWLPPMVHADRLHDSALMDDLIAMVERNTPKSFRAQIDALLNRPDASLVLKSIRCPTLVLCGREDSWSPLSHHEEIAAAIAGARLVVIESCGHMSPAERPGDVTEALRAWLMAGADPQSRHAR
jgi:pimeloyl-ACP methyl ester carboxylesterase